MLSQASGFSILATIGMGRPPRRSRSCCTSSAVRTKESAIRSTPAVRPKCRSARSFSVSDGMLTLTPGRLMPLWSLIGPPLTHFGAHAGAVGIERAQFDGAIGQQDAVARLHVARELGVAGGGAFARAQYPLGRDRESGARPRARSRRFQNGRDGSWDPAGPAGCRRGLWPRGPRRARDRCARRVRPASRATH